MSEYDCATPRCSGLLHATGPDGVGRCLPCLYAYREGMASVAETHPQVVDACLAQFDTLLGPREVRQRPPIAAVVTAEIISPPPVLYCAPVLYCGGCNHRMDRHNAARGCTVCFCMRRGT